MTIESAKTDDHLKEHWQVLSQKLANFQEISWDDINRVWKTLSREHDLRYRLQDQDEDGRDETPEHYARWFVMKIRADLGW